METQERKPFGQLNTGDVVYLYDSNTNKLYLYAVTAIEYKPEQNLEFEVVRLDIFEKDHLLEYVRDNSDKETIETMQFMDVAYSSHNELWFASFTALSQFLEQRKKIAERAIFYIGEAKRWANAVKDFKIKFD